MNRNRLLSLLVFGLLGTGMVAFSPADAPELTNTELPATPAALGERLFHDPLLSLDRSISCASCHRPAFAFSDTTRFSLGVNGQRSLRNAPTVMNLDGHDPFFHDGRAATLELQALGPIENPLEMALPLDSALARLNRDPFYRKAFRKLYRRPANRENLGDALAAFERTLNTNAPFDRWVRGDSTAVSAAAKRGRVLFNEKGKCFECHKGTDFTNDEFRNIGLYNGTTLNDRGRFEVTKDSADLGKFKTPGLRNVSVTGPYMHDGQFATLREVIDYYNNPQQFVSGSIGTDTLVRPLNFSETEKQDLEAFLRALTNERFAAASR